MKRKYRISFICIFTLLSCKEDYKTIDLDKVDPMVQKRVNIVVDDFMELVPNGQMHVFKKKGYVTPLVHTGMTSFSGIYSLAPYQLKEELGDDFTLKLVKVLDKKLVYSFSYEVESSKVQDGSKKLMFDINKELDLAKIHFFIKNEGQFDTKKDWINLFSNDNFIKRQ